jgi:AhpD family alkylhydroperoxidase
MQNSLSDLPQPYHDRFFSKRFYSPCAFFSDLLRLLRNLPSLAETSRSRRVSRPFAEKIMLVVTQVNGCRYCSYGHTRMALASGVSPEEIEQLMALEIGRFPPQQAVALAFAQHYAESDRNPTPESIQRLQSSYGIEVSCDIINYIRMISMGNLAGNAADAFLSRLSGKPAPRSSFLSELFLFLLFAPVILPLLLVMKIRNA